MCPVVLTYIPEYVTVVYVIHNISVCVYDVLYVCVCVVHRHQCMKMAFCGCDLFHRCSSSPPNNDRYLAPLFTTTCFVFRSSAITGP